MNIVSILCINSGHHTAHTNYTNSYINIYVYTTTTTQQQDGYHADLNETFLVGEKVDADAVRLVKCAYEALGAAIALVRPGTLYRYAVYVCSAIQCCVL